MWLFWAQFVFCSAGEALEGEEDYEEDDSEEENEEEEEEDDEDFNPANNAAKKVIAAGLQGQNPQGDCKQQWKLCAWHCCVECSEITTMW